MSTPKQNVKERMAEKFRTRVFEKKVTVFDDEMNCKLYPIAKMKEIDLGKTDKEVAEFLSAQFTVPETGEEVFTPEMIATQMINQDGMDLIKVFLSANGAGKDFEKVLEKNL